MNVKKLNLFFTINLLLFSEKLIESKATKIFIKKLFDLIKIKRNKNILFLSEIFFQGFHLFIKISLTYIFDFHNRKSNLSCLVAKNKFLNYY